MQNPEGPAPIFVGLMSGTSMDGVDAALVRFDTQGKQRCEILESHHQPFPPALRGQLKASIRNPGNFSVDTLGSLDHHLGNCFADAVLTLLGKASCESTQVSAIGCHGQTVRHQSSASPPFTLQIGDPNIIAARTGITTVADFRRRDIALGGQGAPLTPAFHEWFFSHQQEHIVVLNIGGIANVTILPAGTGITSGFDCGPGNTLLDAWIQENKSEEFDASGSWAGSGTVLTTLLETLMNDPYLAIGPPKSTGFEYFNLDWLQQQVEQCGFASLPAAEDIQATLAEFTASSIGLAIGRYAPKTECIFACGGGIHNDDLMARLREKLQNAAISSTADCGLDPDWVESVAFAWLARQTLMRRPGNLPAVTGASHPAVLGAVFFGTN